MRCFRNAEIPEQLLRELTQLIDVAKEPTPAFTMLLSRALMAVPPATLDEAIGDYAEEVGVDPFVLGATLRAHRFLLREAAHAEATESDYAADLLEAAGNPDRGSRLQALMVPMFGPAMRQLREERVTGAVSDHGKVLTGVRWRVDKMVGSSRGNAEDMRVGMLTLHFREGDHRERITFQALPDVLQELHDSLRTMLEQ